MPRLPLDDAQLVQELPLLGDRQFVLSSLSPAEEAARRQLFWMRVAALPYLHATWHAVRRHVRTGRARGVTGA